MAKTRFEPTLKSGRADLAALGTGNLAPVGCLSDPNA